MYLISLGLSNTFNIAIYFKSSHRLSASCHTNRTHTTMNLKVSPLFFLALASIATGSNALLTNPIKGAQAAVNK